MNFIFFWQKPYLQIKGMQQMSKIFYCSIIAKKIVSSRNSVISLLYLTLHLLLENLIAQVVSSVESNFSG